MHRHDAQERLFTDHPGSKRPRYASELGQPVTLKTKNKSKWGRRKRALRKREQARLRSAQAQRLSPAEEAAMFVEEQFAALDEEAGQ